MSAEKSEMVIDFDDEATIAQVASLKEQLSAALDEEGTIVMAVDRLNRIDGACLQLLCAFVKEAAARGCGVCWREPSESLSQSAALLGVDDLLDLPKSAVQAGSNSA